MTPIERQVIAERTKAMTEDEKRYTAKFIPTKILSEELDRRYRIADEKVTAITTIFDQVGEMERNLETMTALLTAIKEVV